MKNIRNAGAFDCAAVERYGITRKNVDIKAKKEGNREKDKKIQKKSFTKGRGDGNINGHSTRESSERTLKTEQERKDISDSLRNNPLLDKHIKPECNYKYVPGIQDFVKF